MNTTSDCPKPLAFAAANKNMSGPTPPAVRNHGVTIAKELHHSITSPITQTHARTVIKAF